MHHEVSIVWIPLEWYDLYPDRPVGIVDLGHGMTLDQDAASLTLESDEEYEAFLEAEHPSDWLELATGWD